MNWKTGSGYIRSVTKCMATLAVVVLAGCGVNQSTPSTNYTTTPLLQGQAFAGHNYLAGATVNVYATQSTGVATNGTYVGKAKLLATTTANTTGGWNFASLTCDSPDQVYVTVQGGTPYLYSSSTQVGTENPDILFVTAIGDCSLLEKTQTVITNEASTLAAAWALQGFISLDGKTVNITGSSTNYAGNGSVGTTSIAAGVLHGFQNANNIAAYSSGNFSSYTNGADSGNGGVNPVTMANSLAYVLYQCTIGGSGSSSCTNLYSLTTPPNGTAPTNILQAALNIARYPTNNVAGLFTMSFLTPPNTTATSSCSGVGQQFTQGIFIPSLCTAPTDWTYAISYPKGFGATSGSSNGLLYPYHVALDADDNAYVLNSNASSETQSNVVALSHNGLPLWATAIDTSLNTAPKWLALDALGHVFITSNATSAKSSVIQEFDASNGNALQNIQTPVTGLWGVAADAQNNLWYTSTLTTVQNLHKLTYGGGTTYTEATFPAPPIATLTPYQISFDPSQNIYLNGYSSSSAQSFFFPNTGSAAAPAYTANLAAVTLTGTINYGVVADKNGTGYAVTSGTGGNVFKLTPIGSGSGTTLSKSVLLADPSSSARTLSIDGNGTVWFADNNGTTGNIYAYNTTSGSLTGYLPCYLASSSTQTCSSAVNGMRNVAVDSTGALWIPSSPAGTVIQVFGVAAPTVPLLSQIKPGVMP